MRHFKDPKFKPLYDALPLRVRRLADKNFALLNRTRSTLPCISNA